jgi:hypothetical protein
VRYVTGFLYFWYDFLVGDAWEVAAGVVIALVVAWAILRANGGLAELFGPLLAIIVIVLLSASVWVEGRKA